MEYETNAYVRQHQRNLDNERVNIVSTNTTNTVTLPAEEPKAPKSTLVLCALIFLAAAFIMGTIAAIFVFPFVAALAIIDGLAAVTFAVLSLRESD